MIAIIDYGLGNLASVKKALKSLKIDAEITDDHDLIKRSDAIILPGVGSFRQGMVNLKDRNLDKLLTHEVIKKEKPFLGICLGMQLIFTHGTEPVDCLGLGWIEGKVQRFEDKGLRIPHMGWNSLDLKRENTLMNSDCSGDVYFIHSYHVKPLNMGIVVATTNYGEEVVAGIQRNNISATQFHPEKSQAVGLSILQSFYINNVKG